MSGVKIVLDTNCIVSALLFSKNTLTWLRTRWQSGEVLPVVCRESVLELIRVLGYPKFKLSAVEQEVLLAEFLPYAQVVVLNATTHQPIIVRDQQDQIFLNLAIGEKVNALVTGDQDLLVLKNESPVAIMTLAEFKAYMTN